MRCNDTWRLPGRREKASNISLIYPIRHICKAHRSIDQLNADIWFNHFIVPSSLVWTCFQNTNTSSEFLVILFISCWTIYMLGFSRISSLLNAESTLQIRTSTSCCLYHKHKEQHIFSTLSIKIISTFLFHYSKGFSLRDDPSGALP